MAPPAPDRWSAGISPGYVPTLAAVAARDRGFPFSDRIHIAPNGDDGAILVAMNRSMVVAVHDARGGTSEPVTVTLPAALVGKCRAPAPVVLTDPLTGRTSRAPPPNWMVPDKLFLGPEAALLWSADDDPSDVLCLTGPENAPDGFVRHAGAYPDWRAPFGQASSAATFQLRLDPHLAALLAPFSAGGVRIWLSGSGDAPMAFRLPAAPEICGVIVGMPDTDNPAEPVPGWLWGKSNP